MFNSARRWSPGLVSFVAAVSYHFCLALLAAFTHPGDQLLAEPCTQNAENPRVPSLIVVLMKFRFNFFGDCGHRSVISHIAPQSYFTQQAMRFLVSVTFCDSTVDFATFGSFAENYYFDHHLHGGEGLFKTIPLNRGWHHKSKSSPSQRSIIRWQHST